MAASQGSEVRVRCEQCFVVFVSLEEFAHHSCVQQQMVDQNNRLDGGIHENHNWIPTQTHEQVDPSQLVTVVQPQQPAPYARQPSPQAQQQTQQHQQQSQQQLQLQAQPQQQSQPQQQQQQQQQHSQQASQHPINNLHLEKSNQKDDSASTSASVDANLLNCTDAVENESTSTASSTSHWTRDATLLLIQLYRDNESNFHRSNRKKKFVWQDIADTLRQHGHVFTRQQVEGRWKTLTAAYRRTTQHNINSMDRRDWPFMEELRSVLDNGNAGAGACRGYSSTFARYRRSGVFNKRRMHLPKPRSSEQAEVIEWLSSYEQRHEQRHVGYMERLEKMHREKVNALTELVDVLKRMRR